MVIPLRAWTAAVAVASLAGCATPPPPIASIPVASNPVASAPAIKPAVFAESEFQPDIAELEAGFAKLQGKQEVLFRLMTAMLEEASRPEVISALKQSAERMSVIAEEFKTVQ